MRNSLRCALAAWLALAAPAAALGADAPLPNAAQEARAQALFHDIRCVVCEGEAIAESQAEVARDMRRGIRGRIAAGDSDNAILQDLVARYGDFILMKPPLTAATGLLWFGPLLILAFGMWLARRYFKGGAS